MSVFQYMQLIIVEKCRQIGAVVNDMAIGAGSMEFDSRVGQIEHSIADGLPPLHSDFRFRSCFALVLSSGDGLCYS